MKQPIHKPTGDFVLHMEGKVTKKALKALVEQALAKLPGVTKARVRSLDMD